MENTIPNDKGHKTKSEILGDSLMIILIFTFALLYAMAYLGKFDPLKDNTLLLHFEPIILIFIGYYLGRHPFRQSVRTLKEEIHRQTVRSDAAQCAKEKAQLECERLEEKIKNARTTLRTTDEKTDSIKTVRYILDS